MALSSASLLGGYSWLFALALLLLLALLFTVFVYRQIGRLRRNNLRRRGESSVDAVGCSELPSKVCHLVRRRIDAVQAFRLCRQPNFTDCAIFAAHAQSQDRFRMIAMDELERDLDRQLEQLSPLLRREPGESTWDYLLRVCRQAPLSDLDERFIARLAFMHEWARYRTDQPFTESELNELRSLLRRFLHVLGQNPQLAKLAPPQTYSTPASSPKKQIPNQFKTGQQQFGIRRHGAAKAGEEQPPDERQPLLR